MMSDEKIIASAINIDWMIIVWKRHSDCMARMPHVIPMHVPAKQAVQWFYTNHHRRVDRREAYTIASEYWQIDWSRIDEWILFSEDLR